MTLNQKIGIVLYIFLIMQCIITATFIYSKAKKNGELYSLMLFNVAIVIWFFLAIIEMMTADIEKQLLVARFTLVPIMFLGALWLIFALYYAGVIKPDNKIKVISLILLPPVLCVWPITTEQLFRQLIFIEKVPGADVWGVLFYINLSFSYSYVVAGVILIHRKMKAQFGKNVKSIWLIVAILIPVLLNIQAGFGIIRYPGFDITPLSFSIYSIIISIYIFKYRFIQITPVAVHELFNTINEAVLICDANGSIIEYNHAAMDYFGKLVDLPQCLNIQNLFKRLGAHSYDPKKLDALETIINDGNDAAYEDTIKINNVNQSPKQYTVCVISLTLNKNGVVGKLVTLRDVTEYRVLTLENERNRLSADLHDSLGNCINVISSNLEYALKNSTSSQEIMECLQISYDKATGAFLHLRRIVDDLKPVDIEKNGLIWALESLFYKLQIKDINIEFIQQNLDDGLLSKSSYGEVIYFICQEAISNAVTHGHAKSISVTLVIISNQLKLYITDDGKGCQSVIRNKGLNSMAARIDALGGTFDFGSPNDGGFNIRAVFPLR